MADESVSNPLEAPLPFPDLRTFWASLSPRRARAAKEPEEAPVNRWSMPSTKDLDSDRRKGLADRTLLMKLSAPFRPPPQLGRLHAAPRKRDESFQFAVLGDAEPGRFWIFRKLFNVPGVFER